MSRQTGTRVYTVRGKNIQPALLIREFCTHEAEGYGKRHHILSPCTVSATQYRHSLPSRPVGLVLPITGGEFSVQSVCMGSVQMLCALTVIRTLCGGRGMEETAQAHAASSVHPFTVSQKGTPADHSELSLVILFLSLWEPAS